MTTAEHTAVAPREIRTPAELQAVMQTDYAPSPQQWAAITADLSPGVVIAGAGSGKTTLMAARVVYLVVTGRVRPDQILGLTFTTKAAGELRNRVREALVIAGVLGSSPGKDSDDQDDVLEPTVATYNAYASTLLTEHGLRIGFEPDTRVITDAARFQLGARAVDRFVGDIEHLTDHAETAIQNLLALDSAMSEHLVSPSQVVAADAEARRGFAAALAEERAGKDRKSYCQPVEAAISAIDRRAELVRLVASYRALKADLGLMDFSDQIELGARLAAEQPEVGALERDKYRVVLLDEYQDTSVAQALMLSRLFSGPTPQTGLGHAVTAVGDPNQAIYGWRGASVSNILNFATTFPAADGEVPIHPLTVNRRSEKRILDLANVLAEPLYDAFPQVAPLEAKPGAGPGLVQTQVYETHREELAALVDRVRGAHRGEWSAIGVLTRDNSHAEEVFDTLTAAGIPVEIVGLSGLLRLPEVAEIVATLRLMHDVTANAALLTLLTGARWAIGPRDLRLLAQRAGEISGGHGHRAEPDDISAQLLDIADGIDPAELPALCDALDDLGDLPYSPQAQERFGLLAGELRMLRRHVGEPLLDIVRRVTDTTGVDIELTSAVGTAALARRDNLDLFVKAVAEFQAVDGDVSLAALLAYLTAEDDQGNGLDAATPTEADSVKLLTVHRSKGLEWDSVFLVGVGESRFPATRGRPLWISSPAVLPTPLRGDAHDLPRLGGSDRAAIDAYRAAFKEHEAQEELRLGYVAFTRARHEMWVTSFLWNARKTSFGPSPFQSTVKEVLEEWHESPAGWLEKPDKDAPHPYEGEDTSRPWPNPGIGEEARLRLDAAAMLASVDPGEIDDGLDVLTAGRVQEWDDAIERLLAEARSDRGGQVRVELPTSLSATAVGRLRDDPEAFARDLARPMPRRPSAAARFGTRFHAWVESRFGQQELIPYDDLEGRADAGIDDESELAELVATFEAGPFADRAPYAVEAPFALVLSGQVVRGRIDAVYLEPDGSYLVVDWKTNKAATADPLQLALYRLAWAELQGVPVERVRAAFHYVRTARTVEHEDLPDRALLERIVSGEAELSPERPH